MPEQENREFGFYGRLKEEFPSQIIVDVSEICNMACIHCPHPEYKKSEYYGGNQIDTALNTKLVDEVAEYGRAYCSYIRYTSNGEPLIHKNIYEMLKYAKQRSGVFVALTTNGKLMRSAEIEKLLDTDLDLIDISIDAINPETYKKIRVGGNLEVTTKNVLELIDRKRKSGKHVKVVTSYVEQPENTAETAEFERFWKNAGADYVVIRRLHSAAGARADVASIMQGKDAGPRKPCVYPWERVVLTARGTLAFCPADWTHGSSITDYRTTTIRETWNGTFYRDLRRAHLTNDFSCHKFCGQCPDWKVINWPKEGKAYASMVEEFKREGADVSL